MSKKKEKDSKEDQHPPEKEEYVEDPDNDVLLAPTLVQCYKKHYFSLSAYVKEIQQRRLKGLVEDDYLKILFPGQYSDKKE